MKKSLLECTPGDIVEIEGKRHMLRCCNRIPLTECWLEEYEAPDLSEYSTMALLQELVERAMRDE